MRTKRSLWWSLSAPVLCRSVRISFGLAKHRILLRPFFPLQMYGLQAVRHEHHLSRGERHYSQFDIFPTEGFYSFQRINLNDAVVRIVRIVPRSFLRKKASLISFSSFADKEASTSSAGLDPVKAANSSIVASCSLCSLSGLTNRRLPGDK